MDLSNPNSPWRTARWPSPSQSPPQSPPHVESTVIPSPVVPMLNQATPADAPIATAHHSQQREMSPHEEDIIRRHVVREVPSKYIPYLGSRFKFHGFKCGAEVEASTDIYIDGELAIKTGVQGIVRGPSDDTDYTRLLVDFYNFHTAINITPAEIKLKSEISSHCPGCGMTLPDSVEAAAPIAAAVEPPMQPAIAADVGSNIDYAEEGFSPAPPESEVGSVAPPLSVATADIAVAEEGMQPAPPSENQQPAPLDEVLEITSQHPSENQMEIAEEGLSPAPATPAVDPLEIPQAPSSFYSRFPEARVSRTEHEALKSELEQLKEELERLKSAGSAQPTVTEPVTELEAAVSQPNDDEVQS